MPKAAAVINPRKPGCPYPFKELAGVGVVFKLICALESDRLGRNDADCLRGICLNYLDIVAIGTVADVMPLVDENRLIVSIGLMLLKKTKRPGLVALMEQSSAGDGRNVRTSRKQKVSSSMIGYVLAPRLNAAGRISNAGKAVDLLLTESPVTASKLASELCEINRRRQDEENRIVTEAYACLDGSYDFEHDPVIVLDSDHWHHGVIGIVSSRLTEHYNLPSILISFDGEMGKGSGRSIKGLNLVEALKACSDCLVKFGGHELAAGLSIRRDRMEEFRRRINDYAREHLSEADRITALDIDCELDAREITMDLANELYLLEPYGVANAVPLFVLRDAVIREIVPIGSNRHTRFILEKDGCSFAAVFFGMTASESGLFPGQKADAVFNLDINDFSNTQTVQLTLRDMRPDRAALQALHDCCRRCQAALRGEARDDEIPMREDFVKLYTGLRESIRAGQPTVGLERLAGELNGEREAARVRARLTLDVLEETGILTSEAVGGYGVYRFTINPVQNKINLDKSEIYQKIRRRS